MNPTADDIALKRFEDEGNQNFPSDEWDPWYWKTEALAIDAALSELTEELHWAGIGRAA